jgi:glutamine amidotransferase
VCRHLAYLGTPRSLQSLVVDPPHSLFEQSWAPARQRHGTVNADGFGVGWYVDRTAVPHPEPPLPPPPGDLDGVPVRYRRAQPIWTDASFASLAPTIATTCAVAAVRSATAGTSLDESAAAPFTHGRWLFSHNGRLHDWDAARAALWNAAADVPDTRAGVDSALLFGLALAQWRAGAGLAEGLEHAARAVSDHGGGRLTMLASDGCSVAGLVAGEPMHVSVGPGGTVVASEPLDDGPWREIPDLSVVQVAAGGLTEHPLQHAAAGPARRA